VGEREARKNRRKLEGVQRLERTESGLASALGLPDILTSSLTAQLMANVERKSWQALLAVGATEQRCESIGGEDTALPLCVSAVCLAATGLAVIHPLALTSLH